MKKPSFIISILILTFFLTSCSPDNNLTPTEDVLATRVAATLTEIAAENIQTPTETVIPSPSATETPIEESATPTPTSTTTPTSTPEEDDPLQLLGEPAWIEDFSGDSSPWDFDSSQATFKTEDGRLNLTAMTNPNWHSWYVYNPTLRNAYVEAQIEMTNCSGFDRFGLVVRAGSDGQEFYFMSITCDGRWGFFRMEPEVNIQEILAYQQTETLTDITLGLHRIGIWMDGPTFTFFIDGKEIGSATDDTLNEAGNTGFLIAYANTSGFTVRVDELKYWNLP